MVHVTDIIISMTTHAHLSLTVTHENYTTSIGILSSDTATLIWNLVTPLLSLATPRYKIQIPDRTSETIPNICRPGDHCCCYSCNILLKKSRLDAGSVTEICRHPIFQWVHSNFSEMIGCRHSIPSNTHNFTQIRIPQVFMCILWSKAAQDPI